MNTRVTVWLKKLILSRRVGLSRLSSRAETSGWNSVQFSDQTLDKYVIAFVPCT